ncbi:MAG: VOC family protein [Actinomycetota bacterium]|nr:VOC family protein [Actinomycetota bacterium]
MTVKPAAGPTRPTRPPDGVRTCRPDELGPLIDRLVSLGATIVWEEEVPPDVAQAYRNVVLRDPEGNELCLGGGRMPT